jgi:Domain of unknown function (DUF1338)
MAWIATEGNAFNHATDRVSNVEALAQALRHHWLLKDTVEYSRSGRVRQTALLADPVVRQFQNATEQASRRRSPARSSSSSPETSGPTAGLTSPSMPATRKASSA